MLAYRQTTIAICSVNSTITQAASDRNIMSKTVIVGWIIMLAGTALWIYGYFATGNPPLFDWQTHTPWWISELLPNIESEIGMALVWAGMVPAYWPR
jgi:hypothetical protein